VDTDTSRGSQAAATKAKLDIPYCPGRPFDSTALFNNIPGIHLGTSLREVPSSFYVLAVRETSLLVEVAKISHARRLRRVDIGIRAESPDEAKVPGALEPCEGSWGG